MTWESRDTEVSVERDASHSDVADLLRSSCALEALHVSMDIADDVEATAWTEQSTLQRLTLGSITLASKGTCLNHLGGGLCQLSLHGNKLGLSDSLYQALVSFLTSSSSNVLDTLCLKDITFDRANLSLLDTTLTPHPSLKTLQLWECSCHVPTVQALYRATFQTTTEKRGLLSNLEYLHIDNDKEWRHMQAAVQFTAALVAMTRSTLERLDWLWVGRKNRYPQLIDTTCLWTTMSHAQGMLRLKQIFLSYFLTSDNTPMNRALPQLVVLQGLHFDYSNIDFDRYHDCGPYVSAFYRAVRQSHLQNVSVRGMFPVFWTEEQARVVRATFRRNQQLGDMISHPPTSGDPSSVDSDLLQFALFPSLLAVSLQTRLVAPSRVLAGLSVLGDCIGAHVPTTPT